MNILLSKLITKSKRIFRKTSMSCNIIFTLYFDVRNVGKIPSFQLQIIHEIAKIRSKLSIQVT